MSGRWGWGEEGGRELSRTVEVIVRNGDPIRSSDDIQLAVLLLPHAPSVFFFF